ncbi:epoxide hydrolase N terminus-domain-containing protein, partial [Mycena floridula]
MRPQYFSLISLIATTLISFAPSTLAAGFDVKPYKLDLSDGLARMNYLINQTLLPTKPEFVNDGGFGISLERLASLKAKWVDQTQFDWTQAENTLNSLKQFTVEIEGLTIHYVYEKSNTTGAKPLM